MDPALGPPVGLGDVAAGEGGVAGHGEALGRERLGGGVDDRAIAGDAETVAEHHVRPPSADEGRRIQGVVGHRVAVEEDRGAEGGAGGGEQRADALVVGVPAGGDPALGLGEGELADHDRPPLADDAGNHPEPGGDAGVEEAPRGAGDQRRVEVVRRPVEVEAAPAAPARR